MAIQFVEHEGTYIGTGQGGRLWRISRVFTGWRLEFRDNGDRTATVCRRASKCGSSPGGGGSVDPFVRSSRWVCCRSGASW